MASLPPKTSDHLSDKEPSFQAEDAVPIYNAHVDVSQVDERKLMRKIDMTLIPWLSLLYLLSFLDRTSIGKYVIYQPFLIHHAK
jgi:hypothetical protein